MSAGAAVAAVPRRGAAAPCATSLARATPNAVRGAQQGFLVGLAGRHLSNDFAPEQDNRPVANQRYFRQLGGEQQHGRTGVGHLAQQPIDLMLCADIDAAGRIEAQQGFKAGGNPACDHHLLLVAATQPAEFGAGAGVDLQALDGGGHAVALACGANEAPIPGVANERQGDVFADRALRQEGLKPIRRDQHEARRDRVSGVLQLQLSTASHDLAAVMAAYPRDTVEQFLLPLTLERGDAENLSRPKAEGDMLEHMAVAKIADFKRHRLRIRAALEPSPRGLGGTGFQLDAKHERDDSVFAPSGGVGDDADGDAIAQNRGAIAQRSNLGDAMRNEDDRIAALAPASHDREDLFRQVRRKRRGDLVEHKHDRIGRQRARQIDEPQHRIWNIPHKLAKFEIRYSKVVEIVPHACQADIGQSHVLADRQVGNERRILVDGDDPRATRFGRRTKRPRLAIDSYGSAIRGRRRP